MFLRAVKVLVRVTLCDSFRIRPPSIYRTPGIARPSAKMGGFGGSEIQCFREKGARVVYAAAAGPLFLPAYLPKQSGSGLSTKFCDAKACLSMKTSYFESSFQIFRLSELGPVVADPSGQPPEHLVMPHNAVRPAEHLRRIRRRPRLSSLQP